MKLAFVYVTDEQGFELARHSAASVALSQTRPCDIYIFCYQFSPTSQTRFYDVLANLQATLIFDSITDATVEQHRTHGHVTTPSLLKLSAVGRLVGKYDRIVYVDNDVLVFEDLRIEDIGFGSKTIAAVVDMDLSDTGALRQLLSGEGEKGSDNIGYFNVGFLVFDSRNWPGSELFRQYADALDQHEIACQYKINCTSIEQCALNSMFENNWVKLSASYNMQAGAKFTTAWRTAMVRHYCGRRKFVPVSLFRNDARDVRYLNKITEVLDSSSMRLPGLYEFLFRLNALRKYKDRKIMECFLRDIAL